MYATVAPFKQTNKAYGNLIDRFLYVSWRGNQYFLIVDDYNSNAIILVVELLKSRTGTEIKIAYMTIVYNKLAAKGCAP